MDTNLAPPFSFMPELVLYDGQIIVKVKFKDEAKIWRLKREPGDRCMDEKWNAIPDEVYGRFKREAEQRVLSAKVDVGFRFLTQPFFKRHTSV